jgi:hypothetical protein
MNHITPLLHHSITPLVWLVILAVTSPAAALENLRIKRDSREIEVTGELLVTTQDGGLLVMAPDGVIWSIPAAEIASRTSDDTPFAPLSTVELGKKLLKELPPGFDVHTTQNYLICHNTSKAYAQWCGALFERLYLAFTNYWSRRGFKLKKPDFPLVAIVFNDRDSFASFSRPELGDAAPAIIGYYSFETNHMTMYDLTGVEALRGPNDRRTTASQINEMLSKPEAERMVATIVHEATHQIAFNCGLQTRYADIPLWVSEGVAVYFEAPDLTSSKGWSAIGTVNRVRLSTFIGSLRGRPTNSLETLLADDARFRDAKQGLEAYAEAWALNYFLIHKYPKQYLQYFQMLAQKPMLVKDDPATRLAEFKQAFGDDLKKLDGEFLRYMSTVR